MAVIKLKRIREDSKAREKPELISEVLMASDRSGGIEAPQEVTLPEQHVIEVELENGMILFKHAEDLWQGSRSGDDLLTLPRHMVPDGEGSRGLGAWAVRAYRFFTGSGLGEQAAIALAKRIEDATAAEGEDRLFQMNQKGILREVPEDLAEQAGLEMMVLIHGTASRTSGSFDPWAQIPEKNENGEEEYPDKDTRGTTAIKQWEDISEKFGWKRNDDKPPSIFAFEHCTLTRSPVQNAIALLDALPKGAKLHLMSHSRGGLVGELLCMSPGSFDTHDFDRYEASGLPRAELEELRRSLAEKTPEVQQFVRVAAPMSGTLLNSDRIDTTLSILSRLMGLVPGGQSFLADAFKEFVRGVVATRSDASVFPGLEAMREESGLVAVLNRPGRVIASPLTIVGGDIAPEGIFRSLAVFATDLFFREEHDLVVNTRAMLAGSQRAAPPKYFLDVGGEVNHFNYWYNKATASVMSSVLLEGKSDALNDLEPEAEVDELISGSRGVDPDKPLVFVLPGIMGSHLRVKEQDTSVWFNLPRILIGELRKITTKDGKLIPDVEPAGVLGRYYGGLIRFLSRSHEVAVFDYDWRKSLEKEAERLAARIEAELDRIPAGQKRPIRVVAHSMGGLVARLMINKRPELWKRMLEQGDEGSVLVMLGTPNRGSMSIVWALLGLDRMVHTLDRIDWAHNARELVSQIAPMPGVLELLPDDDDGKYFGERIWETMVAQKEPGWAMPDDEKLAEAKATHAALKLNPADAPRMSYIAGQAKMTPAEIDPDTLELTGSKSGDGRVLWRTGLLPSVSTWYAPGTSHGDLPRDRKLFRAILDLLRHGQTSNLPQTAPTERGAASLFPVKPPAEFYPSQDQAEDAIMGADGFMKGTSEFEQREPCVVRVCHGDLRRQPGVVAAGRFEESPMLGVERAIDGQLDGQLSRHRALGVYPGAIQTAEVFLREWKPDLCDVGIEGALIVGLGEFGQLSEGRLAATLSHGFMKYGLRTGPRSKDQGKSLTTLPISSSDNRLTVEQSVEAILTAMQSANRHLPEAYRITDLTILELFEDRAIRVGEALAKLKDEPFWNSDFRIDYVVREGIAGRQRFDFGPDQNWVRTIQITASRDDPNKLEFLVLDSGAMARRIPEKIDRSRVDSLIMQATASAEMLQDAGKLLFEWVVPKELRARASEGQNMTLLLDDTAAAYPWEMLQDKWSKKNAPIAVGVNVTRQLIRTMKVEPSLVAASGRILIIGDPDSYFSPLPGAKKEAKIVHDRFLEYVWPQEPVCQIGGAVDVERELTLEENQILHFAGHGVYEWGAEGEKKQTGLITGKDRVLDPHFIDKLRYVPQFVFLNCCFGGTIPLNEKSPKDIKEGDNAMPSAAKDGRPVLAASIAVKFIDAGSKAVIAAGWAVNDSDATRFADSFYDAFLGGDTFANAVTKARKKIFDDASGSDTWSAYQVYGDPQFRLNQGGALQVRPSSTENFVSPRQATLRLRSLQLDARFATTSQQVQSVAQKFKHALDVVGTHSDWSQHPELFEAVADVYAELGNYEKAIGFYERAVRRSPPSLSVNAVENLLALKVRAQTEKRISAQETDDRPKLSELRKDEDASIREAIENLEQQEKVAGDRGAALRQSRIGDCHLRRAACQASARGRSPKAPNNMIEKLKDARTAYETSKTYAAGLPEFNINHAVIRLAFTNFLIWKFRPEDKDSVSLEEIMPEVNRVANDLRESEARRAQFDQRRLLAETRLFELVVTEQPSAKLQADLLDTFSQLFMAGGSIRRRREVVSDLYTVAQLLHRVQDLPSKLGETVEALARELTVSIPVIQMK